MNSTEWLLATVPVVASTATGIATLILTQRHARVMSADDRAGRASMAVSDRAFQLRENRYEDRRDAVIGLVAAAEDEINAVERYEYENYNGPALSDIAEDHAFTELNRAFARLAVLADPAVCVAGRTLRDAVYDRFHGRSDGWTDYSEALTAFQDSARAMLNADEGS